MHHAKLALLAATFATTPALAQISTLYTGDAGLPTSNVPGQPGLTFNDSTSSQTAFNRPFLSPDGTLVAFRADAEVGGTFFDGLYVVTPIDNPTAGMSYREGQEVSSNTFIVGIDERVSVLNDGSIAFTSPTRTGFINNPGDNLWSYDFGSGTLTNLVTTGTSVAGDTVSANTINSPYRAPDGSGVGFAGFLDNNGNSVVFGDDIRITTGDTPTGGAEPIGTFEFESTYFGNDGTTYLTQTFNSPSEAVIVNGDAVIVEGQALSNSNFSSPVVGAASFAKMNEDGTWYARGGNADGTEWVVIDGDLTATEGDPLFAGSSETWGAFDGISVDANGNFAILGENAAGEQVLVYNGSTELAREGDIVPDLMSIDPLDDYTIRDFSIDDMVLSSTGDVVFAARLLDGGSNAGQALLTVAVPEPATAGLLGVAGLTLLRRRR
jgi:hypothetical protein